MKPRLSSKQDEKDLQFKAIKRFHYKEGYSLTQQINLEKIIDTLKSNILGRPKTSHTHNALLNLPKTILLLASSSA